MNDVYACLILSGAGISAILVAAICSGASVLLSIALGAAGLLVAAICTIVLRALSRNSLPDKSIREHKGDVLHVRCR